MLLFFGNALMWMQQMFAVLKLESKQGEGGVKYMALLPLWWAGTSWSTIKAVYELLHPGKRSFWDKTDHGHDVAAAVQLPEAPAALDIQPSERQQGVQETA